MRKVEDEDAEKNGELSESGGALLMQIA